MPGKHVRFAHADVIHYLPTPAPSISSLPSPSSSSSLDLPSRSRMNTFPLPRPDVFQRPSPFPLPQKPIQLHALLQFSNSPVLNFDLRKPLSTITSHHRGIQLRALLEPATHPSLAALTVIIPHVPWLLTVYPSHRPGDGAFVTVEDVLQQIYSMLRTSISAQEFHLLPSHTDRSKVATAYGDRCRLCGPRESQDEKRCGVRRVDFLMGQTKYMGLSSSPTHSGVWVLHSA